MTATCFSFY